MTVLPNKWREHPLLEDTEDSANCDSRMKSCAVGLTHDLKFATHLTTSQHTRCYRKEEKKKADGFENVGVKTVKLNGF